MSDARMPPAPRRWPWAPPGSGGWAQVAFPERAAEPETSAAVQGAGAAVLHQAAGRPAATAGTAPPREELRGQALGDAISELADLVIAGIEAGRTVSQIAADLDLPEFAVCLAIEARRWAPRARPLRVEPARWKS